MWLSDKDSRWCLYHRGFLYEDAKKQTIAGRLARAKRIIFYDAYVANQVHLFQRCVDGTCFYVAQKQSPSPSVRGTHAAPLNRGKAYAAQFEAHMDAGGRYNGSNVRDLIKIILSNNNSVVEKDKSL
jgi:hypothetical protein